MPGLPRSVEFGPIASPPLSGNGGGIDAGAGPISAEDRAVDCEAALGAVAGPTMSKIDS